MPSLAAVAEQLCQRHHRPLLPPPGGGVDAASAAWEHASAILEAQLAQSPPESGAELLRVLAEGALALHLTKPDAAAACPSPLFGEVAARLRRAHAACVEPPPEDPAEREALRRVALKRCHNDMLEGCLERLRESAAADGSLAALEGLREEKPPPPVSNARLQVVVQVRLGGITEAHDLRVKPHREVSQLLATFAQAFAVKYAVDITPLRPTVCFRGIPLPPSATLAEAGVSDGDQLTLVPG
eukprot:Hpha_TRINITY_DN6584_c0_g1::TRINITY_DN6584_c0_g1_i1::g.45992::m.45992